jgi:hypothetical protein
LLVKALAILHGGFEQLLALGLAPQMPEPHRRSASVPLALSAFSPWPGRQTCRRDAGATHRRESGATPHPVPILKVGLDRILDDIAEDPLQLLRVADQVIVGLPFPEFS